MRRPFTVTTLRSLPGVGRRGPEAAAVTSVRAVEL